MRTNNHSLMHIQKQKFSRQWLAFCLLLLIAGIFTACGRENDERILGIDGFVYIAEEVALPEESFPTNSFKAQNGYLYYLILGDNQYRQLSPGEALEMSTSITPPSDILPDCDSYELGECAVGNDGDIYYCIQGYHENRKENIIEMIPEDKALLIRQTADGKMVYQLPVHIADMMNGVTNFQYYLAVDGEGLAYLLTQSYIYVVDAAGKITGTIPMEDYIPSSDENLSWDTWASLLTGEGGKVYYMTTYKMENSASIYEILTAGDCRLELRDELTKGMSGKFHSSPYGLLCDKADGILYQYHLADTSWHPLLRWTDGYASSGAVKVVQLTEDHVAALYYAARDADNMLQLYLLSKTAVEELPEKELLVLASMNPSIELQQSVMEFNRTNDRYHLLLDIYEGDGAAMRLDAALVSSNPPDLLDTSFWSLNINKYAQKELLEDLSPYLDQSQTLHREDFLPNLLEGYTINDRLCSIPSSFSLNDVIMGRPGQVGTGMGWTLADVMALTEKYPDCRLLSRNSFSSILSFCSDCILEEYIDWENGTCDFDNAGFRECIQWMWEHCKESGLINAGEEYIWGAVPEDILLIRQFITSPQAYPLRIYDMGGGISTMIGYPTADGQARHSVLVSDELCITTSSRHKETAWQFIEFFLLRQRRPSTVDSLSPFSTHRETLLRVIEEEATPNYERDEEGNIRLDPNGTPLITPKSTTYGDFGQMVYYYLKREQADALLELIDHADFAPTNERKSTALAIIDEELAGWLNQAKSLDEAIAIIQSRVQLLLNEDA